MKDYLVFFEQNIIATKGKKDKKEEKRIQCSALGILSLKISQKHLTQNKKKIFVLGSVIISAHTPTKKKKKN